MISEYFYMPATNKKVTEDDRIKFTQDRIKSVREFLQKVVFEPIFIPGMPSSEHDPFFDQFNGANPLHADWKAAVVPTHVVINHNWWQKNVEEFCSERRVKIPDIDFFYILMQMCREHNVAATPRDGTMFLSRNKPNWLFNIPSD